MKTLVIALATLAYLLPHPFGATSLGALALYSGALGRSGSSWGTPFIPLTLGLVVTGLFEPIVMVFVFAGYALSTLAGRWFLRENRTPSRWGAAIGCGAAIFYLVSNFSMWLAGFYPQTAAGLLACYIAGLPYLGIALVADSIYATLLFGIHGAIERRQARLATT